MTSVDFTHLPTGSRGWADFVNSLAGLGDWTERHYLELKSELDVLSQAGTAKLVKFTIGAANRDPSVAAGYLDGHAVLVAGIKQSELVGIEPFEAKDLEQRLRRYCGDPGPAWDYQLLPAATTDRKIMVFIVSPPKMGDPIWSCQRDDGAALCDGDVYVRSDGATHKAKHRDVAMLTRRASIAPDQVMDFDVRWDGAIYLPRGGLDGAHRWIAARAESLRRAVNKPDPNVTAASGISSLSQLAGVAAFSRRDRRSANDFLQQVATWEEKARRAIESKLIDHISARAGSAGSVELVNLTEKYYEDVELQIHIPGDVDGIEAADKSTWRPYSILPSEPLKWGDDNHMRMAQLQAANVYRPPSYNLPSIDSRYGVRFSNDGSVTISVNLREVRGSATLVEQMTMVLIARSPRDSPVQASWTLTAKGVDRVLRGDVLIDIVETDLAESVDRLFRDDEIEPDR